VFCLGLAMLLPAPSMADVVRRQQQDPGEPCYNEDDSICVPELMNCTHEVDYFR
jgi:hypothetical protein